MYATPVDPEILGAHWTMVEMVNLCLNIEKFNINVDENSFNQCRTTTHLSSHVLHSWLFPFLHLILSFRTRQFCAFQQ